MGGIGALLRALRGLGQDSLDMLLDRRCPGCGGAPPRDRDVCDACDAQIGRSGIALCLRCLHSEPPTRGPSPGCPRHGHDRLLLAGPRFEPPLNRILHAFKYEGASSLARWIAALLPEPPELRGAIGKEYVLVPVALHPARRARRGFDQAMLLARDASERWGIPLVEGLRRLRDHAPQARCDPETRRVNVVGAFEAANPAALRGRPVILVDDVATTGATLLAAADAVQSAGASWILALTAAHGGDPERPREGSQGEGSQAEVATGQEAVLNSHTWRGAGRVFRSRT